MLFIVRQFFVLSIAANISLMSDVKISPVKTRQLRSLRRLFASATRSSFGYLPQKQLKQTLRSNNLRRLTLSKLRPSRLVLVAANGQLVGYSIAAFDGDSAHLYWLYVDPDQRGRNIGLKLLGATLRWAEAGGANKLVLATHDHRRYYERQGFKWSEQKMVDGVLMDIMFARLGAER